MTKYKENEKKREGIRKKEIRDTQGDRERGKKETEIQRNGKND